jgi:hypothetical protein
MAALTGGPDQRRVAVTARFERREGDGVVFRASLADHSDTEGGDVTVRVSGSADCCYGPDACFAEFEHWVNQLPENARLGTALAMGNCGPFRVVTTPDAGPHVIAPELTAPPTL